MMAAGKRRNGTEDAPFGDGRGEVAPAPWSRGRPDVRAWIPPGSPPPEPESPPSESAGGDGPPEPPPLVPPAEASSPPVASEGRAPGTRPGAPPGTVSPRELPDCPKCEVIREDCVDALEALRAELEAPLHRLASELEGAPAELADRLHEAVLDLGIRIAERILHRAVELDRDVVVETLVEALRMAGPLAAVTVRCHPVDAELLRERAPGLASEMSGQPVEVTVRASEDVERGACILLFEEGIVDARFSEQLERIRDALARAMTAPPRAPEGGGEGAP